MLALPEGAARHVQVLRLQPGSEVTLFDGRGGEYEALIERMGRSEVTVAVGRHLAIEREAAREVHLAVGMPANERMDWLVEKAAELGAASIQPLIVARSVLRPTGERAAKRLAHWTGVAIAACEQCGRNRVPVIREVAAIEEWLLRLSDAPRRMVLSTQPEAAPWASASQEPGPLLVLSGPEGGLAPAEERLAISRGFQPVSLGPRVLRAETAPIALLAALTLAGA
jgi:16S rRNA (uracil1498-N3)-methyltransferase